MLPMGYSTPLDWYLFSVISLSHSLFTHNITQDETIFNQGIVFHRSCVLHVLADRALY